MVVIDTQSTAYIDVLYYDVMSLQLVLQLVDAVTESLEVSHVKYLTTNMEVQTQELDVLHFECLLNYALHIAHSDTKLVFCQACSDVGMCMRTYIRVDAETYLGNLVLLLGEFVDDFQLRDALYVEAEDARRHISRAQDVRHRTVSAFALEIARHDLQGFAGDPRLIHGFENAFEPLLGRDLFGLAQAQLWSGDRAAARDTVARLEIVAPAYPDLAALRAQIAAASPSASASGEVRPAAPAYREAGLSLRHDWLTQGLDPWRAARFEVSGRTAEGRGWYVAGAQERRFGLVDSGVEAGVAVPLAPRWTLQVDGGGWPGSAFQPRWFGDVRAQYAFDRGTVLGASLRRTRYPEVTVDRLALGVEQYWGAWRFGYTFNRTDVAGNRVSGHDIAFDRYYRERDSIGLRLTSGSEDALQGTGIVASAVRAAAVQGRHGIAGDWSMQWAAGYVRQGAFYDRRWVQLGLRRAF